MDLLLRVLSYLFSVGIVAGLVFAAVAFGARATARAATDWPKVSARIVRPRGRGWGTLGQGLRYRYEVAGRTFEGGRIRVIDWPALLWADRDALRARLGGPGLEISVNPALADDALADPTPPPPSFGWLGFGLSAACVLAVLIIRMAR